MGGIRLLGVRAAAFRDFVSLGIGVWVLEIRVAGFRVF